MRGNLVENLIQWGVIFALIVVIAPVVWYPASLVYGVVRSRTAGAGTLGVAVKVVLSPVLVLLCMAVHGFLVEATEGWVWKALYRWRERRGQRRIPRLMEEDDDGEGDRFA